MADAVKGSFARREKWTGLLFVSPWVIGFFFLTIIPMIMSVYLTFIKWDFLRAPKWIGFQNFTEVFTSPTFYAAVSNTFIYTICGTILGLILSVLIAAILAKDIFLGYMFRTIIFLPSLVIGTAFGLMMLPVFGNGEFGLMNQLLDFFGIPNQSWLGTPGQGVWVMVSLTLWYIGGGVVIFIAGIKGIDSAYYEAAMIDGASGIQQFFRVTLPLVSPLIVFQTIMGLIGGLQIFDIAIALSNETGNTGMGTENSLATLVFYLYRLAFKDYNMGEAAVVGWFILIVSLMLSLIVFKLSKRLSFFGEEEGNDR